MSLRLFEDTDQARLYKDCRTQYPDDLFDMIFQFHSENVNAEFNLAVDIGCGPGNQSTLPLLRRFQTVIGVDSSAEQLKHAPSGDPRLIFQQSPSEELPFLESGSVDLVTAATCIHWFNIPAFFQEVERVLTPGGCLAVYGTSGISFQDPKAQQVWSEFKRTKLREFTDERLKLIIEGYSSLHLPFPGFKRTTLVFERDWTVEQMCGFIGSTDRWRRRLKKYPDCDSLEKFATDLVAICRRNTTEANPVLKLSFPVPLLLGRKPNSK